MREDARGASVLFLKVLKKLCLTGIKKAWQFKKLFRQGSRFTGKALRARYYRNTLGIIRLGFSVSGKTGNAVQRNLFKRRLRQYSVENKVSVGFDAVILPQIKLEATKWALIKDDMDKLVIIANGRKDE
jgi:ribonuclease P protein component